MSDSIYRMMLDDVGTDPQYLSIVGVEPTKR